MTAFTQRVIQIIQGIPVGMVMTYGQIAKCAGSPRSARQVVRILHSSSQKYKLPWHRVINSKGELGIQDEDSLAMQIHYLESEGVEIYNRKINLEIYQYHLEDLSDFDLF